MRATSCALLPPGWGGGASACAWFYFRGVKGKPARRKQGTLKSHQEGLVIQASQRNAKFLQKFPSKDPGRDFWNTAPPTQWKSSCSRVKAPPPHTHPAGGSACRCRIPKDLLLKISPLATHAAQPRALRTRLLQGSHLTCPVAQGAVSESWQGEESGRGRAVPHSATWPSNAASPAVLSVATPFPLSLMKSKAPKPLPEVPRQAEDSRESRSQGAMTSKPAPSVPGLGSCTHSA